MNAPTRPLNPAEAARHLGVSPKALRLYEERGLLQPTRNAAGWRAYGPEALARGAEIAALRALGLSLAEIARVFEGHAEEALAQALAGHQAALEGRARRIAGTIEELRRLRSELARSEAPDAGVLRRMLGVDIGPAAEFTLPWPWGGEQFVLPSIRPLQFIVGPLGSGKTRLALRLAETLPGAAFLGLDRAHGDGVQAQLAADPALAARVGRALEWLAGDGATTPSTLPALRALLAGLEAEGPQIVVVDLVEDGLDRPAQRALMAWLRRRGPGARPLFLMTRSSEILDLTQPVSDEPIILCPANHSPPIVVAPWPGAPGYEAVATCLASPAVRARTQGMVARMEAGTAPT